MKVYNQEKTQILTEYDLTKGRLELIDLTDEAIYIPYTKEDIKKIENKKLIIELKLKLNETDYKAIKYAEGLISEDEYKEVKKQRQEWREEINNLENQIK